jgi:hypothetical protein
VVYVFASTNVLYYIYRSACVEPSLHLWDEADLVMVNGLSDVLLDSFPGYSKSWLGLKLFSFTARNGSLQALLAFKVSMEKSAVILMGLPLYVICFFLSYSLQYSFSVLCASCFNDNML